MEDRGPHHDAGPDGLLVGRVHLGNLPFSSIDVPGPPANLDSDFQVMSLTGRARGPGGTS